MSVSLSGANCGEGERARSAASVPGRGRAAVQEEDGEGEEDGASAPSLLTSGSDMALRRGEPAGAGPEEETWGVAWFWVSGPEPDRGCSAAGSEWAPAKNSCEEDVVSGPKWGLGGSRTLLVCGVWVDCLEPELGLTLRRPEENVVWAGPAGSGLVLWSGSPGTRPSTDCRLWSGDLLSTFSLRGKIRNEDSLN